MDRITIDVLEPKNLPGIKSQYISKINNAWKVWDEISLMHEGREIGGLTCISIEAQQNRS